MRGPVIKVDGVSWNKEKLMIYVFEKLKLSIKMIQPDYKLINYLCNQTLFDLNGKKITQLELDRFLLNKYKEKLLKEQNNIDLLNKSK